MCYNTISIINAKDNWGAKGMLLATICYNNSALKNPV